MYGWELTELLAIFLVARFLLEIVPVSAAVALGDGPDIGWGKTLLLAALVWVVSGAAVAAVSWLSGLSLAAQDPSLRYGVAAGASLLAAIAVNAVVFSLILPVGARKALWIAVLEVVLAAFMYALVAGIVGVVVASWQIRTRAALPFPLA